MQTLCQAPRTCCACHSSDQYRSRIPSFSRHDIEHSMHSVAEVDVPPSRRTEHHLIAIGASAMCVTRAIFEAVVCLDLGDDAALLRAVPPPDEHLSKQLPRNRERRSLKERTS